MNRVQEELIDCVVVLKGEISDTLVLLDGCMEDRAQSVPKEKLEILLKKMRVVALTCCGVQDYILELDCPNRKL